MAKVYDIGGRNQYGARIDRYRLDFEQEYNHQYMSKWIICKIQEWKGIVYLI